MNFKSILLSILLLIPSITMGQVYKMYPTKNYHNQLRLNTATGEIQQIQDDGQSWMICTAKEAYGDKEGRFERCIFYIQPLTSMYQYYLINDKTGGMWKFQWRTKEMIIVGLKDSNSLY